jgi:hypothetical protein
MKAVCRREAVVSRKPITGPKLGDSGSDGCLGEEAGFGAETAGEEVAWGEVNGGGISSELVGFRMTISTCRLRARPSVEVLSATG